MGPIVFVTIVLAGVFNPEEVDKAPVYAKRSPSPGFGRSDGEKPVIHVVPHTHNDLGWLKTVSECYYGHNNTIQHTAVKFIIETVVMSLRDHPQRRFTYAEQGFFQRWWHQQPESIRAAVRGLVRNGQLAFVGGGWAQHDEACPHFMSMIDQMTLGHQFLEREFNYSVRVGWQIDPFGHSSSNARLSAQMGMDAQYYARIDYQERDIRVRNKTMELLWQPSPSLGSAADLFSGAFVGGSYGSPQFLTFAEKGNPVNNPDGPSFNGGYGGDRPVIADRNYEDFNVDTVVDEFLGWAELLANRTAGKNVMMLVGSDYRWEQAEKWYDSLDDLLAAVNADGRVIAKYSTPIEYTDAKHAEGLKWTTKDDDYMTIAQDWTEESGLRGHMYWAGYYTSRPLLKLYARVSSSLLQAAKQLQLIAKMPPRKHIEKANELLSFKHWPEAMDTTPLAASVATLTHHDAITGTPKQHVAYDYAKHIALGTSYTNRMVAEALRSVAGGTSSPLEFCALLNQSECAPLQGINRVSGSGAEVVVYNPLARKRTIVVRLPWFPVDDIPEAVDMHTGKVIPTSVLPGTPTTASQTAAMVPAGNVRASRMALLELDMEPLGTRVVKLLSASFQPLSAASSAPPHSTKTDEPWKPAVDNPELTIENELFRVTFDRATGLMSSIHNKATGLSINITQRLMYYDAAVRGDGPWMFSQNHTGPTGEGAHCISPDNRSCTANLTFHKTKLAEEAHQVFSGWATQVVRLLKGGTSIEIEFTVGPVPVPDSPWPNPLGGKEVISRFTTSIVSHARFFTDSNGLELLPRRRNYRQAYTIAGTEPITQNYFPINSALSIRGEDAAAAQLTVTPDRAVGGTSLKSGEIELLIHRRLKGTDYPNFEPLDETTSASYDSSGWPHRIGPGIVVRGVHHLTFDTASTAARGYRRAAEAVYMPPLLRFAKFDPVKTLQKQPVRPSAPSIIPKSLPENVGLLSLERTHTNGTMIVRLGHKFAIGEDAAFSSPATVSLTSLFAPAFFKLRSVTELGLSGVTARPDRLVWSTMKTEEQGARSVKPDRTPPSAPRFEGSHSTAPNLTVANYV